MQLVVKVICYCARAFGALVLLLLSPLALPQALTTISGQAIVAWERIGAPSYMNCFMSTGLPAAALINQLADRASNAQGKALPIACTNELESSTRQALTVFKPQSDALKERWRADMRTKLPQRLASVPVAELAGALARAEGPLAEARLQFDDLRYCATLFTMAADRRATGEAARRFGERTLHYIASIVESLAHRNAGIDVAKEESAPSLSAFFAPGQAGVEEALHAFAPVLSVVIAERQTAIDKACGRR